MLLCALAATGGGLVVRSSWTIWTASPSAPRTRRVAHAIMLIRKISCLFGFAQSLHEGRVVSLVAGGLWCPRSWPCCSRRRHPRRHPVAHPHTRRRSRPAGRAARDVIVVLKRGTDPRAVARGPGATPTHVYDHVIDGFAATVPPQAIRGLEHDPAVLAVVPDHPVEAFAIVSPGDGVAARCPLHRASARRSRTRRSTSSVIKKAKKER